MNELFALFLATSLANVLAPGLGTIMIVTVSLQCGWKKAFWACLGLSAGLAVLFVLAVSGLGVVVTSSPMLFAGLKVVGALYLLWLGVKTYFKDSRQNAGLLKHTKHNSGESNWAQFKKCAILSLTNPQPMVFALSVLPQFIDPASAYLPQVTLMIVAYVVLAFVCKMFYALLAGRARGFLAGPSGPKLINRSSGIFFILIAVWILWRTFS